jgi:predicted aspartyl protease
MARPFTQRLTVARSRTGKAMMVDAVVDTGASLSSVPGGILDEVGVARELRRRFTLADGRIAYYDIGFAWVRLDGWAGETPVVFGDPDSEPLVGCATLDDFGLAVDPVNERLLPVPARQ